MSKGMNWIMAGYTAGTRIKGLRSALRATET